MPVQWREGASRLAGGDRATEHQHRRRVPQHPLLPAHPSPAERHGSITARTERPLCCGSRVLPFFQAGSIALSVRLSPRVSACLAFR